MLLVEQELPSLPEHLSSSPVFSGVRVTRSLVLCVCFVDRCLSFWPFSCLCFDIRILITPLVSSNSSFVPLGDLRRSQTWWWTTIDSGKPPYVKFEWTTIIRVLDFLDLLCLKLGIIYSLEMPVPSQGHCGFPSFPVVNWSCLFVDICVLPFPLEDCSVFGNFVITLIYYA